MIVMGFMFSLLSAPVFAHQPSQVAYATQQLEQSAQRFATIADRMGYEFLSRQGYRLAQEVKQLRRAARHGAHSKHVYAQFRDVAVSYRNIDDALDRSRRAHQDPRIRRSFARLSVDFCSARFAVVPQTRYRAGAADPCVQRWSGAPATAYPVTWRVARH
jgi:hypothetical protein